MSWHHRDLKRIVKKNGKYMLDGEHITIDYIIIRKGSFKDIKEVPDSKFPFVYEATRDGHDFYVFRTKERAWFFKNIASSDVLDKVYAILNSNKNKIMTLILCLQKDPRFSESLIQYIAKSVYRELTNDKKKCAVKVEQYQKEIDAIHAQINILYRQISEKQDLIRQIKNSL